MIPDSLATLATPVSIAGPVLKMATDTAMDKQLFTLPRTCNVTSWHKRDGRKIIGYSMILATGLYSLQESWK